MKKWVLPAALLVLALAALPVLALSGAQPSPPPEDVGSQPPVRSDEGIDPDECNWVHNITACERQGLSPDTPISSGAGEDTPPPEPPMPETSLPDLPEGSVRAPAPIHSVEIAVLESFPIQYQAQVEYGLPNGCARPAGYQVDRDATRIEISVWVSQPSDPNTICTMIYGTAHHSIPLGSDFDAGQSYTITVNGTETTTFTAQ